MVSHFYQSNNLLFIEESKGLDLEMLSTIYDCIIIIDKPENFDTIQKFSFLFADIELEKQPLYYLGNSDLIFDTLYLYFKTKYNTDPFDNIEFLNIAFTKNKVRSLKGDNVILF